MAGPTKLSGQNINLIGPNGKIFTGPVENASKLIESGQFNFLNDEEAKTFAMREFANTPSEQIKNIGSNYTSTATFGASDLLNRENLTPEQLQYENIRRQENPGGSILGTGLGVLIDPFSVAGLGVKGAGKLAQAAGAEKLSTNLIKGAEAITSAGKYAPTRVVDDAAQALGNVVDPLAISAASKLVDAGTSPITHQVLAKIPGRAIRGSTIGGAFAAGQSISEQSLGDMDLNGEKVFADGMNGAMLGLVFDSSLGAIGDTAVAGTKKIYGALKNSDALQNSYSKIISKFASADEATIKATIDAERQAQAIINSAEKDPSAIQNLNSNLKQVFGEAGDATQSQLGGKIKDGFNGIYKLVNDVYELSFRPLRLKYSEAPLKGTFGAKLFDEIEDNFIKNSPGSRILNQYRSNFFGANQVKDANELFKLRSAITGEMFQAGLRSEGGTVGALMREAEDQALILAAKATGDAAEIKLAEAASNAVKAERARYSTDMKQLRSLTESLGLKRVRSFRDFIERLTETDGNILIDKMFKNRANVKGLEFLQKEFPDQFKHLTDAFRNKIANNSTKNGKFNPVRALDLVSDKNLAPEVRRMIFGEAGDDALKAAAKAFEGETAENFARNEARREMLLESEIDNTYTQLGAIAGTVGGIPGAGAGAAIGTALDTITNKNRAARAFLGFEKAFKAFDDKVARHAADIFEKNPIKARDLARVATSSKVTAERSDRDSQRKKDDKDPRELNHEKMINNLSEWSENPDKLVEHVAGELGEMDQFAPGMAQATNATAFRAIDLLKEKLPVMPIRKPLDFTPYVVSSADAFKFGRYYNAVMNPVGVLNNVKDGTLTNDHLETLMRVYPQMYKNMQEILMMEMIKYGDKKEKEPLPSWKKISLSLFLQNNLSDSLEQKNIGANYNNWLNPQMLSGQENLGAPQSVSKGNQSGRQSSLARSYQTNTQRVEEEV